MRCDKKEFSLIIALLLIMLLSRVALYCVFGTGFVDTDARMRYLPQAQELAQSPGKVFTHIGPAYSGFLLAVGKVTGNMVAGAVLVQHIIGMITGFLVFYYFRKVNIFLAFFVTVLVFSGWLALWLEHTILRESLTAFVCVLLVMLFTSFIRDEANLNLRYALLTGSVGLILVLCRVEFAVLVGVFPVVLFVTKRDDSSRLSWNNRKVLVWCAGYFLPLAAVLLIVGPVLKKQEPEKVQYGTLFDASYYSLAYNGLIPKIYYYGNSSYPELLAKYQSNFEAHKDELNQLYSAGKREGAKGTMMLVEKTTEEYLSEHSQVKLSVHQMMDHVYLEMVRKNKRVYLQGIAVNFKEHLVGLAEMHSVLGKSSKVNLLKAHLSGIEPQSVKDVKPVSLFDKVMKVYFVGMIIFGNVLFWLMAVSLPWLFLKWKKMPVEVIVSAFVAVVHLSVLAIMADPSHRFRYPVDPFIYFLQLYLVTCVFRYFSVKGLKLRRNLYDR